MFSDIWDRRWRVWLKGNEKEINFWHPITPFSRRHVLPNRIVASSPFQLQSPFPPPSSKMSSILSLLIHGLALMAFLPALVSAHMVEVPAGKKECFFEDLHVHDKVCIPIIASGASANRNIDDSNISSRWRRPPGHRLLGERLCNTQHWPVRTRC